MVWLSLLLSWGRRRRVEWNDSQEYHSHIHCYENYAECILSKVEVKGNRLILNAFRNGILCCVYLRNTMPVATMSTINMVSGVISFCEFHPHSNCLRTKESNQKLFISIILWCFVYALTTFVTLYLGNYVFVSTTSFFF